MDPFINWNPLKKNAPKSLYFKDFGFSGRGERGGHIFIFWGMGGKFFLIPLKKTGRNKMHGGRVLGQGVEFFGKLINYFALMVFLGGEIFREGFNFFGKIILFIFFQREGKPNFFN